MKSYSADLPQLSEQVGLNNTGRQKKQAIPLSQENLEAEISRGKPWRLGEGCVCGQEVRWLHLVRCHVAGRDIIPWIPGAQEAAATWGCSSVMPPAGVCA